MNIEAGALMVAVERGGMERMEIYRAVGISAKEGRYFWTLAKLYADIDAAELDRREQSGRLMSKNQAVALEKCASLLNDEERGRLIANVRDKCPLDDPEFGPQEIAKIAGSRTGSENSLRERLGIEQARVDELRATAPVPPVYYAEFVDGQIVVTAPTFPLVFAALSKDADTALKSVEFFSKGNSFVIRRKD